MTPQEWGQPQSEQGLTKDGENDKKGQLVSGMFSELENDSGLAQLVEAWPALPEHVKQTITSIVRSTTEGKSDE